eukprot:TRINITY_DN3879_c0_g1_i1.p1 TRINITY_DN3879_c0_g1~~TRINITY_DN3879_c0_g1_i1.p1  ORF type:complete len:275 (+),score=60.37 TRINITY_DN3879_c0_g1_i1:49-825(+)
MCIRDRSTQSTWGSKSNYSRKMVNSTPKRGLELNGLKLTVSGIFGALIGILTSVVVNSCLAEISINPFFSLYFGILFIGIGIAIVWRILTSKEHSIISDKKGFLFLFAILIIASGLFCFIVEKDIFRNWSPLSKVPLYGVLGMSICFAIVFSIVDLINYICGICQRIHSKPIVDTPPQIYAMLLISFAMGSSYGLFFGFMDIEDQILYMPYKFLQEEYYCLPIGLILGGFGGVYNEYLRQMGGNNGFTPLPSEFTDEI